MSLTITANDVRQITEGVWLLDMPPHQIRHFGKPVSSAGPRSVILLDHGEYDRTRHTLTFGIDSATALNIGTTSNAIAIEAREQAEPAAQPLAEAAAGPGDRAFLQLVRAELTPEMATAAEAILRGIRARSPGDLKRGQTRNFSETPDNFWYIIVQPRINELSITVRGAVEHFQSLTELEVKDDRGNTRFKVRGPSDVSAALKLISHAVRKS